ncbi:MAG TPA: hypothetical protein VMX95_06280 [Thermodesulfobacteriota bacterium]|nr:hypothetical protein [Thermodesulfobacteriota bacterium]
MRIIDESSFPADSMVSEKDAGAMHEYMNISVEKLREISGSVVSIKVQGIKPL